MAGTATAGSDYQALGTSVSFTAGASTVTKTVTPLQDSLAEADETVILTLAAGTGYSLGSPASATVTLISDDLASYTVTASGGANGSISPASQSVAHGATTTFTVTPDTGYSASATGCGGSLSDTTYTTGAITAACAVTATFVPMVSVAATDNSATEAGLTTGTFTFTRTGATTAALTVTYAVTGTATAGKDYRTLGTDITFPIGKSKVTKKVTPLQDTLVEPNESIILRLKQRPQYAVGSSASGKVILSSDD